MIKKFKCICGYYCDLSNIKSHLNSKKHDINTLEKRAPTENYLIELLNKTFNIKDKITTGKYLEMCNKQKIVFEYWKNERNFNRIWNYEINDLFINISYYDHLGQYFTFKRKIKIK